MTVLLRLPDYRTEEQITIGEKMAKLNALYDAKARAYGAMIKEQTYEAARGFSNICAQIRAMKAVLPKLQLVHG